LFYSYFHIYLFYKNRFLALKLRHIYNPELRYFVLKKENLEKVSEALKLHSINPIPTIIEDLVVEL
jgi:hypothetical protein